MERRGFAFASKALNPILSLRGENRIRTCEPVLPATRFPGVPLQPLEHLSFFVSDCKGNTFK